MDAETYALKPSLLIKAIERVLMAGLVPLIRSSPGLGKSDIINAIGKVWRLKVYDFRLSQADVTDLNGLPFHTEDGRASFLPFENFPLEDDELPDHPDGGKYDGWLLFFDELTSAPKQLQAASYKIILERLVGLRKLHKRVMIVCAGNLATDKAVVHDLSTALQSRLIHLFLKADLRDWVQWALGKGIDNRIIGFLEFKPEYLHKFDPDHDDHTYPCPRTWEFCSRLINGEEIVDADMPLVAGTVGQGVGFEFVEFAQVFTQLPKLADVKANPKTAPVPREASMMYAMATHLASHFDNTNVNEYVEYIKRFPVEFQAITLRLVHMRLPQMLREPAFAALWGPLVSQM